jgi:hypothetical protein
MRTQRAETPANAVTVPSRAGGASAVRRWSSSRRPSENSDLVLLAVGGLPVQGHGIDRRDGLSQVHREGGGRVAQGAAPTGVQAPVHDVGSGIAGLGGRRDRGGSQREVSARRRGSRRGSIRSVHARVEERIGHRPGEGTVPLDGLRQRGAHRVRAGGGRIDLQVGAQRHQGEAFVHGVVEGARPGVGEEPALGLLARHDAVGTARGGIGVARILGGLVEFDGRQEGAVVVEQILATVVVPTAFHRGEVVEAEFRPGQVLGAGVGAGDAQPRGQGQGGDAHAPAFAPGRLVV